MKKEIKDCSRDRRRCAGHHSIMVVHCRHAGLKQRDGNENEMEWEEDSNENQNKNEKMKVKVNVRIEIEVVVKAE